MLRLTSSCLRGTCLERRGEKSIHNNNIRSFLFDESLYPLRAKLGDNVRLNPSFNLGAKYYRNGRCHAWRRSSFQCSILVQSFIFFFFGPHPTIPNKLSINSTHSEQIVLFPCMCSCSISLMALLVKLKNCRGWAMQSSAGKMPVSLFAFSFIYFIMYLLI